MIWGNNSVSWHSSFNHNSINAPYFKTLDNKNSLTFGGVPKMLVVSAGASGTYTSRTNTLMIILYGMTGLVMTSMDDSGTNNMTMVNISQSGSNISWYGSNTAEGQLNKSGKTYYYVALL